jgi:hypothetical protein
MIHHVHMITWGVNNGSVAGHSVRDVVSPHRRDICEGTAGSLCTNASGCLFTRGLLDFLFQSARKGLLLSCVNVSSIFLSAKQNVGQC